jgi:hypothetical protein
MMRTNERLTRGMWFHTDQSGNYTCQFCCHVACSQARGAHELTPEYVGEGDYDEYLFELDHLNGESHESRRGNPGERAKMVRRLLKNNEC